MRTIYLDMDDVVADFNGYARKMLGIPNFNDRWAEDEWNRLRDNQRLYRDLNKTVDADVIVKACRTKCVSNKWNLMFLTAIPRNNDIKWAFYDKMQWATKHYPGIPVMFGPYSHDKHTHCMPGDVLIDDRTSNCDEWREVGGIAIQHCGDVEKTVREIESL